MTQTQPTGSKVPLIAMLFALGIVPVTKRVLQLIAREERTHGTASAVYAGPAQVLTVSPKSNWYGQK